VTSSKGGSSPSFSPVMASTSEAALRYSGRARSSLPTVSPRQPEQNTRPSSSVLAATAGNPQAPQAGARPSRAQ
jgi:hypothetical protein